MRTRIYERRQRLPVSAAEAFAWHARAGALERLIPPWERIRVVAREGGALLPGSRVELRQGLGPMSLRWTAEHREREDGRMFRDVMLSGPFASWDHCHEFVDTEDGGCELRDRVEYALPGGAAGRFLAGAWARRKIEAMFAYRHATTRDDLRFFAEHGRAPRLRVLISGASGLVGRALSAFLTTQGHEVIRLARRERGGRSGSVEATGRAEPTWDPGAGIIDLAPAGRIDAVVHLAGAGIAEKRWTADRRRVLRDSRVKGTRLLAEALAGLPEPPKVVVGGSAIGFYGDAGDRLLDEASPAGAGFLADLCRDWETSWAPLATARVRLVHLRTGVVLSPAGGALAKLRPPFLCGLGGRVGSGRQWWSWISIDDLISVIGAALVTESMRGPLNAVAPEPLRNADFVRVLGRVLRRPALLPAPAWALRAALGRGLAEEGLLASQRVVPAKLLERGFRFRHPDLESALRHVLGRVSETER